MVAALRSRKQVDLDPPQTQLPDRLCLLHSLSRPAMPDILATSKATVSTVLKLAVSMAALEQLADTRQLDRATRAANMEATRALEATFMVTASNSVAAGAAITDINRPLRGATRLGKWLSVLGCSSPTLCYYHNILELLPSAFHRIALVAKSNPNLVKPKSRLPFLFLPTLNHGTGNLVCTFSLASVFN